MKIIVALSKHNNGIGIDNKIPWYIKTDLNYFKDTTSYLKYTNNNPNNLKTTTYKNMVVMGRKTWDSIPKKYKPLENRINIVLSTNTNQDFIDSIEQYKDTFVKHSFDEIISICNLNSQFKFGDIFIIGGSTIYNEAIRSNLVSDIYITEIYEKYECDTYFPVINSKYKLYEISKFHNENDIYFRFLKYKNTKFYYQNINEIDIMNKIYYEEQQYLDCLSKIINEGLETNDRTGVGTLSIFGEKFEYNLEDTFPALTTKRVFFRGIVEELLLYISGKTDNTILNDKNIHIWDGNTTRDFLDKRDLSHYPEGDMGETYGFNFRHYGGEYKTCKDSYNNIGFDQLNNAINLIKTNPNSRRIIINLWNPYTNHKAALPSCLCFYQFYVDTKNKKLNLQIYIRSSDFFLANNWNTLTGALLVHMICNLSGIYLTPGILKVITGDTHIYKTHIEQVNENISRNPRPPPKLIIKEEKNSIEEYTYEDFKLIGYHPYKNISAQMAV